MSQQGDQLSVVVESICEKLLKAKWIESYEAAGVSDYQVVWTELGDCRKRLLRHVIRNFQLDRNVASARLFTEECHHLAGAQAENFEDSAKEFWNACCLQVELACEEPVLWAFVRILAAEQNGEKSDHECLVKFR